MRVRSVGGRWSWSGWQCAEREPVVLWLESGPQVNKVFTQILKIIHNILWYMLSDSGLKIWMILITIMTVVRC